MTLKCQACLFCGTHLPYNILVGTKKHCNKQENNFLYPYEITSVHYLPLYIILHTSNLRIGITCVLYIFFCVS